VMAAEVGWNREAIAPIRAVAFFYLIWIRLNPTRRACDQTRV